MFSMIFLPRKLVLFSILSYGELRGLFDWFTVPHENCSDEVLAGIDETELFTSWKWFV